MYERQNVKRMYLSAYQAPFIWEVNIFGENWFFYEKYILIEKMHFWTNFNFFCSLQKSYREKENERGWVNIGGGEVGNKKEKWFAFLSNEKELLFTIR